MMPPIKIDRDRRQPLQLQIYEQLRNLILSGILRPGQELPGSRTVSVNLGVSRNTVLMAFDRLLNEGYLESQKAKKTFVSSLIPDDAIVPYQPGTVDLPADRQSCHERPTVTVPLTGMRLALDARPKTEIDFFVGRPDPGSFPTEQWMKLMRMHLASKRALLTTYGDPTGLPALREAIARHLGAARGMNVRADQIVVTSGIQEALCIVARLFADLGRPIAIENPCYEGLYKAFALYGAKFAPMNVGASGPEPADVPDGPLGLICVTPSHQFPTGRTMTLDRRLRLLELARQRGAYVLEDDYDSDFRYDGPPLVSLAGLDQEGIVIYLGTFSKSIGAGLRLGYAVFPDSLIVPAITIKSVHDNGRAWLSQAVLTDFLTKGHFLRHLRRIRISYRKRRDCLVAALNRHFEPCVLSGVRGGMHLMWQVPPTLPRATVIEAKARGVGVGVYSLANGASHEFHPTLFGERGLLFGYAAVPEHEIEEAIERLAGVLR